MKNIFVILIIFCSSLRAQSPIIPADTWDGTVIPNSYVQDINNRLDPYVGTYILNNNNRMWKIVLQKKLQMFNGNFYEDIIIGEYEFEDTSSAVVAINTLPNLLQNYTDPYLHTIAGRIFIANDGVPICSDCNANERRLVLMMTPPNAVSRIVIRRISVNGQDAIKLNKSSKYPYDIPDGEYVLIKQ